jgi:hypothetical protein
MVDNLLKFGMKDLEWWPKFLVVLKATLNFCRDYEVEIVKDLKAGGKSAVAHLVSSSTLVHMAEWRWHTCQRALSGLSKFLDSLRGCFHLLTFLGSLRDGTMVQHVRIAMEIGGAWALQFGFVAWYCNWLTPLQQLAGRCVCHPTGKEEGANECPHKGRVLKTLHASATTVLQDGLHEANKWTSSRFGGDATFLRGAQGAMV